jgi:interleukin-1 receptor-associated kinase 1
MIQGVLPNGKTIAVKKLSEITNLDDDQFQKEVTNLFGLKHKNIVQLVGYCAESWWEATETSGKYVMAEVRKRLICFEYINNKSLDKHLPGKTSKFTNTIVYCNLYCILFQSEHWLNFFRWNIYTSSHILPNLP